MTKNIYARLFHVAAEMVAQSAKVHAAELERIDRSRQWLARQKKALDAIAATQAVFSSSGASNNN